MQRETVCIMLVVASHLPGSKLTAWKNSRKFDWSFERSFGFYIIFLFSLVLSYYSVFIEIESCFSSSVVLAKKRIHLVILSLSSLYMSSTELEEESFPV